MTRVLDIPATTQALRDGRVDVEAAFARDPNTRRIIEALCLRHDIAAVFKDGASD